MAAHLFPGPVPLEWPHSLQSRARSSLVLLNLFVSLCPLTIYLFMLGGINRRERPVIISGVWEVAGLLFAFSGFALFTGPRLLNQLYIGELNSIPLDEVSDQRHEAVWQRWVGIWIVYYLLLLCLIPVLLFARRNVRGIYNVDLEQFRHSLFQTLNEMNLAAEHHRNTLSLFPLEDPGRSPEPPPLAAFQLNVFPAFCHVSLHWHSAPAGLQRDFEAALESNLASAAAMDNPAAGWFLGAASLLFGALFMILATMVFARFFPRRGF